MSALQKHNTWFRCLAVTALPLLALMPTDAYAQDNCPLPADLMATDIPDPIARAEGEFNSLCAFHTWAWNAFLWSVQEVQGGLLFETFPTQDDTINGSFGPVDNVTATPTLALRPGKGDHPIDSIAQAGTLGILVAQNNRAVYYSQYINPQMYDEITAKDWNNAKGLRDTPVDKGKFDVGDIELKAAWAVVGDGFEVPGAYTRKAMIPLLENVVKNGVATITVPANPTYVEADVALIGLHVVGWVNEHSEAIWASFSPIGIAPTVPTDEDGQPVSDPKTVVSDMSTPFYQAGTQLGDCNQTQTPVQTLDEETQKLGLTTQACQHYVLGSLLPAGKDNQETIAQINASAASSLPEGSLGKSYFEVGAVWSHSDSSMPDKVNTTFQDALVGSTVLSNPVIETFTQTERAQNNCFSCHNSLQFQPSDPDVPPLHASLLNLSHFLMQIYIDTASTLD